jgi:hypothetical protein
MSFLVGPTASQHGTAPEFHPGVSMDCGDFRTKALQALHGDWPVISGE